MQREPARRLDQLRRHPVALGGQREHASEAVERFVIAARRVHVDPGREIGEQEVELVRCATVDARGLRERDRR